jgi:predicted Zn-dependent protease
MDFAPKEALKIDRTKWEKQVREWSAIMREFPEIQESGVNMNVEVANRYLINSEGTKTRQPLMFVSIRVYASTQAVDGSSIDNGVTIEARTVDQLPAQEEITKKIRQMATDLTNLRKAPVLDANYDGPVLFTGQASTEMFAQLLAPELSSNRSGMAEQATSASVLAERLNRPVLPNYVFVFDDPTAQATGNQPLMGAYKIDDQGVPSRRVSLIERGVLKDLLMSRRPRKEIRESNGHGRSALFGRTSAHFSNLFIESANGKSYDDLKRELIEQCKIQNLEYGILIKSLETAGSYVPRNTLTDPVLAYKVYVKDGHEELVRGAIVGEINTKSLKQMIAIGNDNFVENLATATPSSIIAPSVLLEELELKKPVGSKQKPRIITHPFFNKP